MPKLQIFRCGSGYAVHPVLLIHPVLLSPLQYWQLGPGPKAASLGDIHALRQLLTTAPDTPDPAFCIHRERLSIAILEPEECGRAAAYSPSLFVLLRCRQRGEDHRRSVGEGVTWCICCFAMTLQQETISNHKFNANRRSSILLWDQPRLKPYFISSPTPPKIFSKVLAGKFFEKIFSESKNSSIFELTNPQNRAGIGHFGSGRSSIFIPV